MISRPVDFFSGLIEKEQRHVRHRLSEEERQKAIAVLAAAAFVAYPIGPLVAATSTWQAYRRSSCTRYRRV